MSKFQYIINAGLTYCKKYCIEAVVFENGELIFERMLYEYDEKPDENFDFSSTYIITNSTALGMILGEKTNDFLDEARKDEDFFSFLTNGQLNITRDEESPYDCFVGDFRFTEE